MTMSRSKTQVLQKLFKKGMSNCFSAWLAGMPSPVLFRTISITTPLPPVRPSFPLFQSPDNPSPSRPSRHSFRYFFHPLAPPQHRPNPTFSRIYPKERRSSAAGFHIPYHSCPHAFAAFSIPLSISPPSFLPPLPPSFPSLSPTGVEDIKKERLAQEKDSGEADG